MTNLEYTLEIYKAVAEAVRELSAVSPLGGVPSGELYARLMGVMSLATYQSIVDSLVKAKLVKNVNHLLVWSGHMDTKEAGVEQTTEAQQQLRHLAHGASLTSLCGLDRATVSTVHPSKARKTDCQECKDIYRLGLAEKKAAANRPETLERGARVEFADGSAWLVEDVRASGVDVKCLIGSKEYTRGRTLTISAGSFVRVFLPGEFEAMLESAKQAAEAAKLPVASDPLTAITPAPAKAVKAPREGVWKPTVEEVAEVKRLRAMGLSYGVIEVSMNWPDGHGNRPFRICKGAYDAK